MPDYTTDPDAVLPDPPVLDLIDDGEDLDAAHLNPAQQALGDITANYIRYGAKMNAVTTFNQGVNFEALVTVNATAAFTSNTRRAAPFVLANVATQTINPNTQGTNLYAGILATNPPALGAAARIVRLDTVGVFNGDWVRVNFNDPPGSGVWVFRRGADNAHDLCILDNGLTDSPGGDVPNAAYDANVTVEFQVVAGVWRLVACGINVVKGTYA